MSKRAVISLIAALFFTLLLFSGLLSLMIAGFSVSGSVDLSALPTWRVVRLPGLFFLVLAAVMVVWALISPGKYKKTDLQTNKASLDRTVILCSARKGKGQCPVPV